MRINKNANLCESTSQLFLFAVSPSLRFALSLFPLAEQALQLQIKAFYILFVSSSQLLIFGFRLVPISSILVPVLFYHL